MVAGALSVAEPPPPDAHRDATGPFDIVGDVHGCAEELRTLLERLGYAERGGVWRPPEGRTLVFLGDLVDRGPDSLATVEIARRMIAAGHAHMVLGNHDAKFSRWLEGRKVKVRYGLEQTVREFEALPDDEQEELRPALIDFFWSRSSHLILDEGRLVVAHAGLKEKLHGQDGSKVWAFCLYGDTDGGERDEYGLPIRHDWAAEYTGEAMVVYGHTPRLRAEWKNHTICLDTGCVFGGSLTALRYPERELVSVPAAREYLAPTRPLA